MPADLKSKVAMIPAEAVPDVWPRILPGLNVVQEKAGADDFDLIYHRPRRSQSRGARPGAVDRWVEG